MCQYPPYQTQQNKQTKQKEQVLEYNRLASLIKCGVLYRLSGVKIGCYKGFYKSSLPLISSMSKQKQHNSDTMSIPIDFFMCLWCVVGGGGEGVGRVGKCITPNSIAEFFNSSKPLQPEKIFTEFFDFE